ncbi:MAG: putative membrane protein [Candidatus Alkanophagales archaeon MCA70_species_1]|nr:putative membrane protein [Candidatus Alkanophaga volatiphilum]
MTSVLLDASILASKLLLKTLPFMLLGVLLAEFIVALGVVEKLSWLAKPITRFSHLREECGVSFLLAFISPTAANAMLADYYEKGFIEKKELFIAAMINSFPAIVMHWRYLLPVVVPLLGVAGVIYFGTLMLVGLLKTTLLMLVGRLVLEGGDTSLKPDADIEAGRGRGRAVSNPNPDPALRVREAFRKSLRASEPVMKRMVVITVPTMFLVCLLMEVGAFDALSSLLGGVAASLPVPPDALGVIAAHLGHHTAACTVASGLLAAGRLSVRDVVITLLFGNVLASVTTALRFFTPHYVSIFGPRVGLELMAVSTAIRDGIALVLIAALMLLW